MKGLDLCCGAGGCSMGYHQAGFIMIGVDINPQKNYPFEFLQANALEVLQDADFLSQFDFIHASPPARGIQELPGNGEKQAKSTRTSWNLSEIF